MLDAQFPGRRFAVFYRPEDGPEQDLTAFIAHMQGAGSCRYLHSNDHGPKDVLSRGSGNIFQAAGVSTAGAAEFLRIETRNNCGDSASLRGYCPRLHTSIWAVGRIPIRVEARSFDRPLDEATQCRAENAFVMSWGVRMQVRYQYSPAKWVLVSKEEFVERKDLVVHQLRLTIQQREYSV